jgi:hypothetical protein
MSETPKFVLEAWLAFTGHGGYANPEVRDAIRAVLAQLEQARIDRDEAISQCVSIGRESKKMEAERDTLREIMRRLVHGIDEWNASVEPIIGRPVDYKWLALEEARAALTPEGKP